MRTIILGGGLAGLSLAHFLDSKSVILEKEEQLGGLCRSFKFNERFYDIGPHILFSKNKDALGRILSLIDTNTIKRSNRIFHKGRFVKYPFENDLAALDDAERDYCLKEFLNNPYENFEAKNILQFFLKTFGEGITKLYLQPYNEKAWKFDPSFMDVKMVERIPKPPREDVIKSAEGIATEGHLHQAYFHYPKKGGIQSLIGSLAKLVADKTEIVSPVGIKRIFKEETLWKVETDKGVFSGERLVNCMPIHEFLRYFDVPDSVMSSLDQLKYNSVHVIAVQARKDNIGDNFSLFFGGKDVIFHRLSKFNSLGGDYGSDDCSNVVVEITFRPGSYLGGISKEEIKQKVLDDLDRSGLIDKSEVVGAEVRSFKYAYVIYDLDHRRNIDFILGYLEKQGVMSCGRFAEFEYLNMDGIFEHSFKLAERLNSE